MKNMNYFKILKGIMRFTRVLQIWIINQIIRDIIITMIIIIIRGKIILWEKIKVK